MTTEEGSVPVLHDSVLEMLEAEAIFIMREVAAEFERPVLLFSGGRTRLSSCASRRRRSVRRRSRFR